MGSVPPIGLGAAEEEADAKLHEAPHEPFPYDGTEPAPVAGHRGLTRSRLIVVVGIVAVAILILLGLALGGWI